MKGGSFDELLFAFFLSDAKEFFWQNLQAPEDLVEGATGGSEASQDELKRLRHQLEETCSVLQSLQGLYKF